jgi:hypothetical protein
MLAVVADSVVAIVGLATWCEFVNVHVIASPSAMLMLTELAPEATLLLVGSAQTRLSSVQ